MSFVAINVLTVPPGAGATLEQRFAGRAGMVESAPGLQRFELLRPIEGTENYLVVTHWATQTDYAAWLESPAFAAGHAKAGEGGAAGSRAPAAAGSQIWTFEVVQGSAASDAAS
jgi:heme-degrading monooxygenase HmoA